jgi:hypothetical protein
MLRYPSRSGPHEARSSYFPIGDVLGGGLRRQTGDVICEVAGSMHITKFSPTAFLTMPSYLMSMAVALCRARVSDQASL